MFNKEDWALWQQSPVTKALMKDLSDRIEEMRDVLEGNAGGNPLEDGVLRGIIKAFREVKEWEPTLEEETDA